MATEKEEKQTKKDEHGNTVEERLCEAESGLPKTQKEVDSLEENQEGNLGTQVSKTFDKK